MSIKTVGVICHDTPNLSLSQPQADSSPPSAMSLSQKQSTSFCVSQFMTKEMDSLNLKSAPPLRATNFCPSSSNSIVSTDPTGWPIFPAVSSLQRKILPIFEFLKTDV